jgi:hypothetical protein
LCSLTVNKTLSQKEKLAEVAEIFVCGNTLDSVTRAVGAVI